MKFCQVIQEKLHQVTSATICKDSFKLIDTLASEGAQDVHPAAIRKESFKVINESNAKGARANMQTYCCVKITALKLQRNKDFQFIVESDSQDG